MALQELSPLSFWLCGHKDGRHAGVHHFHVGEEFVNGLRLSDLAMGHEMVGHFVTLLSHVLVVAKLLDSCFQHISETSAVFGEVVCDVCDGAEVVIDRGDVDVGVPNDNPLGIVIIDENFINVAPQEDFTALSWLLDDGSLIHLVCDGLPVC